MDHISQALERAKAENTTRRDWITPERNPLPPINGQVAETVVAPEHLRSRYILCGRPEDAAMADHYRLLRTRILHAMRRNDWTVLGITSPNPRAGKTLTAINLAISAAREGTEQVVLVDADLRRPMIADDLGLGTDLGLVDYLARDVSLDQMLVRLDLAGLLVIPGRSDEALANAPELLHSPKLATLLRSLRERTPPPVVIVDLPPVLIGDDVLATAPLLDCLLLVIEEAGTEQDDLSRAYELLTDFPVIGTVLNKSAEREKSADEYTYYSATAPHS